MIDTHCHILPDLDDGPADWEESLLFARMLAAEGVTAVIATPHQLGCFSDVWVDQIRLKTSQLNSLLVENQIELTVYPGAEVRLDGQIPRFLRQGKLMTLADGGRYLLLELPSEIAVDISALLDGLAGSGLSVVLAHAERNLYLHRQPQLLSRWVEQGLLLQVTASGLSGQWGPEIMDFGWYMVLSGMAHLVASDAHDTSTRQPRMVATFRQIQSRLGSGLANRLLLDNPACILDGSPLRPMFAAPSISGRQRIVEITPAEKTQKDHITQTTND
jgi:protein-tyrosine phosphatase